MIEICRHIASTVLAVTLLSAYPIAQSQRPPDAETRAPVERQVSGQPPPGDPSASGRRVEIVRVEPGANAHQVRDQLRQVLERHPPSVANVLRHDPTLLSNADYLAPYPELEAFLASHPEIARNPSFYVGTPQQGDWGRSPAAVGLRIWEQLTQGLLIVLIFGTITGVLVWLVRTLVDYRRWLRLTKVQTETHTKLLDRLTNQEDLLAYMQTPAGRRFLESAPIALDASSRPLGAPLGSVLWSVQAGVVLLVLGIGVLFVGWGATPEIADGVRVIGVLGLSLGLGFVLSGAAAYGLSRRMGVFESRPPAALDPVVTTGVPRVHD
jgi:hypothetical protein